MNSRQRIRILKVLLGQASIPTSNPIGSTTQSITTPTTASTITLASLPSFNPVLFSAKPAIINNINTLVNYLNTNMFSLSGGKVNFNIVYTNASISGSEFTNSLKQLVVLAKWIYNVCIFQGKPYDISGLKQFAKNLQEKANSSSFPDAPQIAPKLVEMAQTMLSQLG